MPDVLDTQLGVTADTVASLSTFIGDADWMKEWREAGWKAFDDGRLPTRKDEKWRFTNLRGLDLDTVAAFQPMGGDGWIGESAAVANVEQLLATDAATQAVHVGGTVQNDWINRSDLPEGVIVDSIDNAIKAHPELVREHLGSLVSASTDVDDYFVSMHQASFSNGIFVYVPRNVRVEKPISIAVGLEHEAGSVNYRLLAVTEEGAEVTIIERFGSGEGADTGFSNAVVELVAGANSHLNYVTSQQYAEGVWHFATHRAAIHRDATVDWTVLGTGARGGKSRMEVFMREPGAHANLTGAYFLDGEQAIDFDTLQVHEAANATSDLSFKGALSGKSRSVWRGMIEVARGAQGTDSYQDNRNLLLSSGAHADSIPGLQIEANEVRCTHGSTIGKLDQEQMFYLKARGLSEAEAMRLLVRAFFVPVLDRIGDEGVRESIEAAIDARLDAAVAARR